MYVRTVKTTPSSGVQHEYVRLVESYREDGRVKQRVVANLGRKDLLAPHLDALVRLLRPGSPAVAEIAPQEASCWGPVLATRQLWRALGLDQVLERCGGPGLADRALVLVANRLCRPGSEHRLAPWLETDYVCDREGRRWRPAWEEHGRVQVDLSWLQRWYRTLDELLAHKEAIEEALYRRLRDLFSLKVDLVFYDLTSTYFEGAGPKELGRHGYSRDEKPRQRQVLVGMVMVGGWPIAHQVFAGNQRDAQTVAPVLEDLQRRFGLKRVVLVGDRGMVTTDNLEWLRQRGHGYLVGLQRRRREEVFQYIAAAKGPWTLCPTRPGGGKTEVQEVAGQGDGVRVFVVRSEERLEYERGMRELCMERAQAGLEKLVRRVAAGKLKAPEKIGAAAARVLARHHGHRYYTWSLEDGQFQYREHAELERERAYEGTYLIQTEERGLTPVEAVEAYKDLSDVERGFRHLKDVLDMRPIYHRRDDRAHIFVAALALLLERALERKLKAADVTLSAPAALEALRTVQVVDFTVGEETRRGVTGGSGRARQAIKALGINDLNPPPEPSAPRLTTPM
jgi:transposase